MELAKHHILYIEDHQDTREFISLVLAALNYKITKSSTIEDALRLAANDKFDLYILDSWLPDGSGIDLCKKLREVDATTPIMFYSAHEADKQKALSCGAQAYLVKPCDTSELCSLISSLIGNSGKKGQMADV